MKALVVYESKVVARVVADGLGEAFEVRLAEAREIPSTEGFDLLVVGGPTHAFGLSRPGTRQDAARQGDVRPSTADVDIREYLDVSPMLTGLTAATFDTKVDKPLPRGSAAHKAHRRLRRLGCRMARPPESFKVDGTTGPLVAGELERARTWARELAAAGLALRHTA
ncbi:flavodoxin [Paractinoplanes abujensis]|uniref:Flavodoxin n=1 Tax=Paractinoplanes abujensis TaxID=882441 RepID=A0A7W7CRN1_9ACTN|nr:flavodoxin family protein [Actinoplanes abujensis]MBB4693480.1 hypothetical protein [Actinoplanes abujensis]GID21862.1 flavodoxin [Actinoplanes abujensis]